MSNSTALRFMNIGHFLDHFFLLVFPTAVLALHQEWGMSYGDALALGTPGFVLFALATYPCGWLGDRWGKVPMMRLFFLGMGASAALTGLAQGPLTLMVGLGAVGLFAAIYHPVATAVVVQLAEKPGRELGVNGVWGNLGVALAAAVTGGLTAMFSWRAAFILPGLLTLALGAVYLRLSRQQTIAGAKQAAKSLAVGFSRRDQRLVFLVVAISALFGGLVFNGVTIALPKLFEERLDSAFLGIAGVGAVTTAVLFAASFTQLFTGRLVDRVGPRPVLIVASALQVPLLVLLGLLSGIAVVPLATPLMLMVFGVIPVSSWLLGHYVSAEWRSRAYGVQFLLAFGVNAGVLPLIAFLHERTGSSGALFLVLGLAAGVVFLVSLLLPQPEETAEVTGPALPAGAPATR